MVFPVWDDNPFHKARLPLVTWGLILVNVAIFLLQVAARDPGVQAMLASLAATPAAVAHKIPGPGNVPAELTLVSYQFLHGGWEHIIGNMLYLWVFGDDIEDALGPVRFIAFYLLCGVAAALAFVMANTGSRIPLVGASGAVSGILAAYLLLRPCAEVSVFVFRAVVRMRAFWVIGAWVALQLYMTLRSPDDGVAYMAHVGGLVAGALLFLVMRPAGVPLLQCVGQRGGRA